MDNRLVDPTSDTQLVDIINKEFEIWKGEKRFLLMPNLGEEIPEKQMKKERKTDLGIYAGDYDQKFYTRKYLTEQATEDISEPETGEWRIWENFADKRESECVALAMDLETKGNCVRWQYWKNLINVEHDNERIKTRSTIRLWNFDKEKEILPWWFSTYAKM